MEDKSIRKIVGENLKFARKAKGITQKELALELGKYQSDYSEYETGNIELDYEKNSFFMQKIRYYA